ncbi:hypothetical protein ACYOEI_10620 [Singulisphaera rosea]
MLERDDRLELARRVLDRYTGLVLSDSKAWRGWLKFHRDRPFLNEARESQCMVAPESLTAPFRPVRFRLNAKFAPTHREPAVAEVEFTPARARAGEDLTMVVRVAIAPAWHIAAGSVSRGSENPTSPSLKLPPGLDTDGDWTTRGSRPEWESRRSYREKVEFRSRIRVSKDRASGPVTATCTLGYQAYAPSHAGRRPNLISRSRKQLFISDQISTH